MGNARIPRLDGISRYSLDKIPRINTNVFVDWDLLVKDTKTGKTVWLAACKKWSVIVIRQVQPHVARLLFVNNRHKDELHEILENMNLHGFTDIYTYAGTKVIWLAQSDRNLEGTF